MNTAWKGSLLLTIALAACDHTPTTAPPPPHVRGAPTAPVPNGLAHRGDNVVVASGQAADSLVRRTAVRWAAAGHRSLQAYLDTSRLWRAPSARPSATVEPIQPPDGTSGYVDLSYLTAQVASNGITVALNDKDALITGTSSYIGTDAHLDLTFGANYDGGQTDIPQQVTGSNDGHVQQKLVCASELMSGSQSTPDCLVWTGTVTASAQLRLSQDCGEYAYGSMTTTAWYELPIPKLSLGTGGASVTFVWMKYGVTGPVATGRHTAYQASCPQKIEKTPACGQLIYDAGTCNPPDGGTLDDPRDGNGDGSCQTYLVQLQQSYDGGETWTTVASWFETIC
jgi:hypothetical protein